MNANFLGSTVLFALDYESTAEAIGGFAFENAIRNKKARFVSYHLKRTHGDEVVSITPAAMLYARTFGEVPDKAIIVGKIRKEEFTPDFEELLPLFRKYGPGPSCSKNKAGNNME